MSSPDLPPAPPAILVTTPAAAAAASEDSSRYHLHYGAEDGSAGVLIDQSHFIGGEDEHDVLRLYSLDPQEPVKDLLVLKKWPEFQQGLSKRDEQETDIEAAALLGDVIYWIGSHSHGKPKNPIEARPYRSLLFATTLTGSGTGVSLQPQGVPFTGLIQAIKAGGPDLDPLKTAIDVPGDPKDSVNTFNIEGLCAIDGVLYIGFRTPIHNGRALILPVRNPAALISGKPDVQPDFGRLLSLDLGGLGIRDMAVADGKLLILAGSYKPRDEDPATLPRLYSCDPYLDGDSRWNFTPHRVDVDFGSLNPEGILTLDGKGAPLILSDDGKKPKSDPPCFRSVWLKDLPKLEKP